jgi:hypothetical protein
MFWSFDHPQVGIHDTQKKSHISRTWCLLHPPFHSSTLKMEVSVPVTCWYTLCVCVCVCVLCARTYQTTLHRIPEDCNLHFHCYENLICDDSEKLKAKGNKGAKGNQWKLKVSEVKGLRETNGS